MSKAKIHVTVKNPIFRNLSGKSRRVADKGDRLTFRKKVGENLYQFDGGIVPWLYLTEKEMYNLLNITDKDIFVIKLLS